MTQTVIFKGRRRSDNKIVEQPYPVKVETPGQLPAMVAALLQQMFGLAGLVYKDPDHKDRVTLTPANELVEIWADIPSIIVVDALEGESLIKP